MYVERRARGLERDSHLPAFVEAWARFGLGDEHENDGDADTAHSCLYGVQK